MDIKHIATGAVASMFTDVDTGKDYMVLPCEHNEWECLYMVISADSGQAVHNVDGATQEEALRNYLEYGQGAVCKLRTLYCDGTPVERLDRPGCDTEYKVRGVPIVCTMKRITDSKWAVFEDGSDKGATIQAGSAAEAVLQYITAKKGEHNA